MKLRSGSRRGLIGSSVPLGEMFRRISMHGIPRGRHRLACPISNDGRSLETSNERQS